MFLDGMPSNLIDLNAEPVNPPPVPLPRREHDYVNDMVLPLSSGRDVFDMRK